MRFNKIMAWLSLAVLVSFALAHAQGVQQQVGMNGAVNFTRRTITATGIGMSSGKGSIQDIIRAAKKDALENLLEVIKGIALTSSTTLEQQMLSNDVIKTRLEGIAKISRQVGPERTFPDGSLEVTLEINLIGPFLEAVLPQNMGGGQPLASAAKGSVYTGLIVDATGLGARPALAPRILNENGQEVYGISYASREWAVKYGMAEYEKEISAALKNERGGDHPLIANGTRVLGTNSADVVISNQNAQVLHSMKENLNFLGKCRVIIVLD